MLITFGADDFLDFMLTYFLELGGMIFERIYAFYIADGVGGALDALVDFITGEGGSDDEDEDDDDGGGDEDDDDEGADFDSEASSDEEEDDVDVLLRDEDVVERHVADAQEDGGRGERGEEHPHLHAEVHRAYPLTREGREQTASRRAPLLLWRAPGSCGRRVIMTRPETRASTEPISTCIPSMMAMVAIC